MKTRGRQTIYEEQEDDLGVAPENHNPWLTIQNILAAASPTSIKFVLKT